MFLYFIDGFLYAFGLSDNPLKNIKMKYTFQSDNEAISNDWQRVGIDINKAFHESKETYKA